MNVIGKIQRLVVVIDLKENPSFTGSVYRVEYEGVSYRLIGIRFLDAPDMVELTLEGS